MIDLVIAMLTSASPIEYEEDICNDWRRYGKYSNASRTTDLPFRNCIPNLLYHTRSRHDQSGTRSSTVRHFSNQPISHAFRVQEVVTISRKLFRVFFECHNKPKPNATVRLSIDLCIWPKIHTVNNSKGAIAIINAHKLEYMELPRQSSLSYRAKKKSSNLSLKK